MKTTEHKFYGEDTPTGMVTVASVNPYKQLHTAVALRFDVGSTTTLREKCGSDGLLVCDKRFGVVRQVEQATKWALRHRWVWSNDTYIAVYRDGVDYPVRLFSLASLIKGVCYDCGRALTDVGLYCTSTDNTNHCTACMAKSAKHTEELEDDDCDTCNTAVFTSVGEFCCTECHSEYHADIPLTKEVA